MSCGTSQFTVFSSDDTSTYLNHRLLVCDAPSRLLRVVVDRNDSVELGRVRRRLLARVLVQLGLRRSDEFVRTKLRIELRDDAERLLVRRRVFARASCGFFCGAKRVLQTFLFLCLCEAARSGCSARDAQKPFRGVRSRAPFDFDLEVTERHIVGRCGGLRLVSGCRRRRRLLFLRLAIGLPLGLLLGIALLVEPVETFASETGAGGLSLAALEFLKES